MVRFNALYTLLGLVRINKYKQNNMNLFDEEHDWREHWKGTLSFNQENKKPIQKITVSFENESDVEKFAELTGYKITKKTKSIWFPFREKDKPREYAWIDNNKTKENE